MPKTSSPALAERDAAAAHAPDPDRLAGETDPRRRLLLAAIEVFARQGYERATTREICQLAGANVAAIHYHFGDKAELYRETIRFPITQFVATSSRFEQPDLSLADALEAFFRAQLEPLLNGDDFDPLCALLAREMADPSGVLGNTLAEAIEPHQRALEQLLRRHVGAARVDADIELLAMALVGMGAHFTMARDLIDAMRPKLLSPKASVERAIERLTDWSVAMVEREQRRRADAAATRGRR
jgi:TetR/AcrR family transcriptional regulator, regulator of cefoperazone and chloramphenicol sensitivity